jgi:hypothetical protein
MWNYTRKLKIGLEGVDWIHMAHLKGLVACSYEHGNEPCVFVNEGRGSAEQLSSSQEGPCCLKLIL